MTMILDKAPFKERTSPGFSRSLDMSVAELEQSLSGIAFPATKKDLIVKAMSNGAAEDVLTFIHLLPDLKYCQFHDITFLVWSYVVC
ncbi:DUF2795 domain-containing protein [Dehalogenimonas sp. 4OHTPN]|uniref:DUF2795 domain-containing protein n=1 Tax=Dehalogenimonas sp. 4OHTPN TaxID=3166643 RepID=A0AAU8GBD3_9CHLR